MPMKSLHLADIMTRNLVTLPPEATLGQAVEQLAETRISSILIRAGEQVLGIVTEQDILRAYGNNQLDSTPLAGFMSSPVLSAPEDMEFRSAYHHMTSHGVRHLLVLDANGLAAGIVSQTDFERHLSLAYYRRLKAVQAVMQHSLPTLAPQATIAEAVSAMAESHGGCVVVVEQQRPVGLLTERDVVRLFRHHATRQRAVGGVMTLNPVCIPSSTSVADAADLMHSRNIRHLPVVDQEGLLVGLVSETDLLQRLESELVEITGQDSRQARRKLALAEARWQAIFHQAAQFMGVLDGDGRLLEANSSALELINARRESVLGRLFWETPWWTHDPEQQEKLRQAMGQALAGRPVAFEVSHPGRDGSLHWVSFRLRLLEQDPDHPPRLLAEGVDITQRHLAESRLRLAAGVFSHSHDAILITDPMGVIMDVNPAFCRLTGYARQKVVGQHARLLNSGHHDDNFFAQVFAEVRERGHWQGEVVNRRQDGSAVLVLMTISVVHDEDGQVIQYVGLFSDITDKKEHEKRLERLAHYDGLTGLPNRSLLADRLRQAIAQARRRGSRLAVAYLDLDGFKPVNDQYGHHMGDRLLVEVASRLQGLLRAGDTAARLGGDEFVLLINDLDSLAELESILERVLDHLSQPFQAKGHTVQISASIGVTLFPDDGSDGDALLRHADQAMYEAKRRGQNRYYLFDVAQDQLARELRQLVGDVRQGLAAGEFQLHYQPKVNLCNGLVVGLEALLRWRPAGSDSLRLPGSFLPSLANHEVVEEIGHWVIREALAQMERWQRQGLQLPVSVNLAPRQLQAQDFLVRLQEALACHPDLDPGLLELEVVETAALEDLHHTSRIMAECQSLGVSFSLDDFGTGYSSLAYFKNLPATTLKIDQSFVRDMLHEPEALAIVEGIIGLTNAFQRNVVAEGVESEAHGTLLVRLGCILAQGFAIARPMPGDQVPAWVKAFEPLPAWISAAEEQWRHEDYPLIAAEVDHRHWKEQVEVLLARDQSLPPGQSIPSAHHCRLGRWLSTQGRTAYGHLDIYGELVRHHDAMHAMVSELLAAGTLDAGRLQAFQQAGDLVLADLRKLQQIVSRLRQIS